MIAINIRRYQITRKTIYNQTVIKAHDIFFICYIIERNVIINNISSLKVHINDKKKLNVLKIIDNKYLIKKNIIHKSCVNIM